MKRSNSDNSTEHIIEDLAKIKRGRVSPPVDTSAQRLDSTIEESVVQRLLSISDFAENQLPHEIINQRYEIMQLLGEGSFAKVIKAKDLFHQKEVAIKIGSARFTGMNNILNREINTLKRLDHTNIIKVYDYYTDENLCCIIMELVDGGELLDRIYNDHASYTERRVQQLASILLSAIQHMHGQDVVHRDLKPDNLIMVDSRDYANLKIVDFGGAAIIPDHQPIQCNFRIGTAYYMSPEIVSFQPHGKSADLWSFGIIIYLLLFGTVPYRDVTKAKVFSKIQHEDYVLPTEPVTISQEAKDFVRSLLQKNPTNRLTVTQAINHPWFQLSLKEEVDLSETKRYLGRYQIKKRLRKILFVIFAVVAFRSAIRSRMNRREEND